jgi:putative ABC transport system permease protein
VVLTAPLAERFGGDAVVRQRLRLAETDAEVIGVVGDEDTPPMALGPFAALALDGDRSPPELVVHARRAEDVAPLADSARSWLDGRFAEGEDAFTVATDAFRSDQVRRGMLLFKVVMGLITGVSVVVGGVGVMNVLLMAVTERTREIGVRQATGATRRDIVAQFLSEAVTVSCAGCALGLGVGLGAVFVAAPLIRHLTEVPFQPVLTWGTLGVVAVVALAVGVVFGTYPAWRASRLSPVEAIRHE